MKLSKRNQNAVIAYNRGYSVKNNIIQNPKGKIIAGYVDNNGYRAFSITKEGGGYLRVVVSKLVAYQKFKNLLFEMEVIRHIDGNPLNDCESNIELGTQVENMQDIPKIVRVASAIKAATMRRRFSDVELDDIRQAHCAGSGYKELMQRFNISSKGTLFYILKSVYVTTK